MQLVGRHSSLFTRMPLMFACELGVPLEFVPVPDMTRTDAASYAGNPALKLPILRMQGTELFGALNICRAVAENSTSQKLIIWPELLADTLSRNAQEMVWHCMAAQVQLVMGTVVNHLPAQDGFFAKARAGLQGSLQWLDARVHECLSALPPRGLSVFEVSLFCLVEHLAFRPTIALDGQPALRAFAAAYGERDCARRTAYRFD
ncbi:MAG TPA: glutathione S-transferase N-terminal domain-containing protein [Steroidobacteraceae bacterium]|nr:glutathione S-transferase N-terminal domain-containing protein [Steroidobacteraceae bacterium]